MPMMQKLSETKAFLKSRYGQDDPHPVEAMVILGSGLGAYADTLIDPVVLPYSDIPHFHASKVEGHAGNLVFGKTASGVKVACMQGRFHYYEGHDMDTVVYPVRAIASMGAKNLVVTNAAGGVNASFKPGTLMVIRDHLNMSGVNPLRGKNCNELGPRFPDMSTGYCAEFAEMAKAVAKDKTINTPVEEGVYAFVSGPSYETPAEVRMLRTLGADAVGMSTAPEVIVANHMGMKVLGISCITNPAAGVSDEKLDHQEVMDTANRVKNDFLTLLDGFFERYAKTSMANSDNAAIMS